MNNTKVAEYAKHDPALARMSIFRPVSKGKRNEKKLDIAFDYKNKCLYNNGFFSNRNKYFEEISKHIKPEPKGFDAWIVIIK